MDAIKVHISLDSVIDSKFVFDSELINFVDGRSLNAASMLA